MANRSSFDKMQTFLTYFKFSYVKDPLPSSVHVDNVGNNCFSLSYGVLDEGFEVEEFV